MPRPTGDETIERAEHRIYFNQVTERAYDLTSRERAEH